MYRSIKPHGYLDNRASARDIGERETGMRRGREERKSRRRTEDRDYRFSKRRQRLVDAPSLEWSRGKYATARNKGRFRTKDYRFPCFSPNSEGAERTESFCFVLLHSSLPLSPFLYLLGKVCASVIPHVRARTRALNHSCVREICEMKFIIKLR